MPTAKRSPKSRRSPSASRKSPRGQRTKKSSPKKRTAAQDRGAAPQRSDIFGCAFAKVVKRRSTGRLDLESNLCLPFAHDPVARTVRCLSFEQSFGVPESLRRKALETPTKLVNLVRSTLASVLKPGPFGGGRTVGTLRPDLREEALERLERRKELADSALVEFLRTAAIWSIWTFGWESVTGEYVVPWDGDSFILVAMPKNQRTARKA